MAINMRVRRTLISKLPFEDAAFLTNATSPLGQEG